MTAVPDPALSQTLFEYRAVIRRIAAIPLPGEAEAAPTSTVPGFDAVLRGAVESARLALIYADDS